MKYSGLYFITNPSTNVDAALSTVSSLTQGIETSFQSATRQPPWTLFYRAFRDTIPPGYQAPAGVEGKPQAYAHSYQHLLHLSSLAATRTYVYAQPVGQPATITSIPLRQQDAHASVLRHQSSALWTQRHVLSVREGTTYSGGLCTIQIGEVRATREGPQSGAVSSPGVVLCITTVVGADDAETVTENGAGMQGDGEELDTEYAQAVIRECWNKIKEGKDLGRAEVREAMMVAPAPEATREQQREAAVRMWCDGLRMRG
ncbi:mediator complex subunit med20 [Stemphylium lycopersici]|uniref:Mediator of RNA polymerase II transcription subunit 20 n=1 Tax=Stemphylium lycopersici TaxID=183478 RepID=A0A364N4K7_STELY|nr:mediator complex subunit med20 [Stemphylium lycopersici]RAR11726.1 mediator complex subunit med20 [Stemphylium lycopersici]